MINKRNIHMIVMIVLVIIVVIGCSSSNPTNNGNENNSGNVQHENGAGNSLKEEENVDERIVIVDAEGNGDFTSIQEAANSIPISNDEPYTIYVREGTYKEKVLFRSPYIRLIGESKENTIITYDDYASKPGHTVGELGTRGSASVSIRADYFYAENITFANDEVNRDNGQAVAVYVTSPHAVFNNVRFLGNQDTLYADAEASRQYYKDCYIEGTTDFIFGSATAVFDSCTLHSKKESYITAASTPENKPYGYVFLNNKLTYDPEYVSEGSVYLGRPWRPFASVIFVNTEMDRHIKAEGWHNWGNPENERTARYFEYGSYGAGAAADSRVDWSNQLTKQEAAELTIEHILGGEDGWDPLQMIEDAQNDRERLLEIVSKRS